MDKFEFGGFTAEFIPGWLSFHTDDEINNDEWLRSWGKWLVDVNDGFGIVVDLSVAAMISGLVKFTKLSEISTTENGEKRACWCLYVKIDDIDTHRKILKFLKNRGFLNENNNVRYKTNWQTKQGLYGKQFKPILKPSDFIDLKTGEFIKTEKEKEEERMEATRYFENKYPDECKRIESALNRTISPEEIEKTMEMFSS